MSDTAGSNFASLPLSEDLLAVVREIGFENLTPIQAESLPPLLSGKDLVGQSKTGSGKTVAFSLPILQKIDLARRDVQALVLCPTRELCTQVAREIRKLGRRHPGLHVLILSGGQPARPQAEALAKGAHIVVGTPGRVLDHLSRGRLETNGIGTLVLDEADRMLDMGFQDEMEAILREIPENRQTVFFSATYPATIKGWSRKYQIDPVRVTVKDSTEAAPSIEQKVYVVDPEEKIEAMLRLIRRYQPESALVFCNQKAFVSELAETLAREGISCASLHGDLEQRDRDRVLAMFRNGSTRVLVATDVAARGLDIQGLDMVFNFDLPHQPDIYVHRIGRTGRAGRNGSAISLASDREIPRLLEIERYTGAPLERATLALDAKAGRPAAPAPPTAEMQTLAISGGRKDKLRPGDILGALTGEAGGFDASDIGKIEIHDTYSYVAVSSKIAARALERLKNGRIKGRKFQVKMAK